MTNNIKVMMGRTMEVENINQKRKREKQKNEE